MQCFNKKFYVYTGSGIWCGMWVLKYIHTINGNKWEKTDGNRKEKEIGHELQNEMSDFGDFDGTNNEFAFAMKSKKSIWWMELFSFNWTFAVDLN